ncbi:hypothetical protein EDC96DRAFT_542816 [Choanephora cucurbitarum]|nr:hypothetical protein EDC96DRAFT_542816 [Choanephora cucurbitarum]
MLLLAIVNLIQIVAGAEYTTVFVCFLLDYMVYLDYKSYMIIDTLEITIQMFYETSQFILLTVVVAVFAPAFIEQYMDSNTSSINANVMFVNGIFNNFTDVFKFFKDIWFFIFDIWNHITCGDATDSVIAILLAITFYFIVLLMLFNIAILIRFGSKYKDQALKRKAKNQTKWAVP